jgi:hypothetical protein
VYFAAARLPSLMRLFFFQLFADLLQAVLHAPMGFFDTTPGKYQLMSALMSRVLFR